MKLNERIGWSVLSSLAVALAFGGSAAASGTTQELAFKIVIPPHCFEVLDQDVGHELTKALRDKNMLCKHQTSLGKLVRIEVSGGATFVAGAPNALHRAGFD